jgi:hypothetical protein
VRRRRLLLFCLALVLFGAAVPTAAGAQTNGRDSGKALVRLAHFAENVAVGDIYVVTVNGVQKFDNVPYKTVSDYLPLDPGTYKIEVRPARAPSTSPAEAQLSVSVQAGRAYSVCVWGEGQQVSAMVLNDAPNPPPAGEARVRAINAIAGATGSPVELVGAGGKVLVSSVEPSSASDYVAVPAGTTQLTFRSGGKTLATAKAVDLKGGSVSSVAAIGGSGKQTEALVASDQAASGEAPAGGVATGAGGTAPPGATAWLLTFGGIVAVAIVALLRRRRSA